MTGYTFKTYIADGREWFGYGEEEISGWQRYAAVDHYSV